MSGPITGETAYAGIPGGTDLVAWFGNAPNFHDAEIVELSLHRRAPSTLRLHYWGLRPSCTQEEIDAHGAHVQDKHVVVTFTMEDIRDLYLDGFSHQNVISELVLGPAPDRPERRPYMIAPSPDDLEIELKPCFGLDGFIRCRKIRIDLTPGRPNDDG